MHTILFFLITMLPPKQDAITFEKVMFLSWTSASYHFNSANVLSQFPEQSGVQYAWNPKYYNVKNICFLKEFISFVVLA